MLWRKQGDVVEGFPLDELSDHLQDEGCLVWVDLCEPTREALDTLAEELFLDPHAVEDSVAFAERPKATRHASHTFVTVYATRLVLDEGATRGALESRLETARGYGAFLRRSLPPFWYTTKADVVENALRRLAESHATSPV